MKKTNRKIISGALLCVCSLIALYSASQITERAGNGALPVSLTDFDKEDPVIILDAGHGEST